MDAEQNKNPSPEDFNEALKKLREQGTSSNQWVSPNQSFPQYPFGGTCPSCGYCPTCGRHQHWNNPPYWYGTGTL